MLGHLRSERRLERGLDICRELVRFLRGIGGERDATLARGRHLDGAGVGIVAGEKVWRRGGKTRKREEHDDLIGFNAMRFYSIVSPLAFLPISEKNGLGAMLSV